MSELKPTFSLPSVDRHIAFERIAPSGVKRLYKIIPMNGNRFAIVLYLDQTPMENAWTNDSWNCNTFNSEEEFKARVGQEIFDLAAEVYDRQIKPVIYQKLFDSLMNLPKSPSELVSEEDKTHPFYVLKAKLAFLDSISRVNDKGCSTYSTITDEDLINNRERIENDFRNIVTVNLAHYSQIAGSIHAVLADSGSHETILLKFEVINDSRKNKHVVNKTCRTLAVRNLVKVLDEFTVLAEAALREDRADTITSLMAAAFMLITTMEGFKLFEHE